MAGCLWLEGKISTKTLTTDDQSDMIQFPGGMMQTGDLKGYFQHPWEACTCLDTADCAKCQLATTEVKLSQDSHWQRQCATHDPAFTYLGLHFLSGCSSSEFLLSFIIPPSSPLLQSTTNQPLHHVILIKTVSWKSQ